MLQQLELCGWAGLPDIYFIACILPVLHPSTIFNEIELLIKKIFMSHKVALTHGNEK
jgi:hypothetical protein